MRIVKYVKRYKTPEGFSDMLMSSDGEYLTGLWFIGSRDERKHDGDREEKDLPVFEETVRWLDMYYQGVVPDFTPKYRIEGATEFRKLVIDMMLAIPYGETVTYGDIANAVAEKRGVSKMSAQAIGGAVGWNPICIIIPCHRVMGANGALTGYGGGIDNKVALLELEQGRKRIYVL